MENVIDLQVTFDSRSSFYGKAKVKTVGRVKTLISYDTEVAEIKGGRLVFMDKRHSQTTSRHIKEFMLQNKIELLHNGKI